MPVLDVQRLEKHYGTTKAVDGVSFSVEEGEIFGLIGPNGAGKTTALECCLGLRRPSAGKVRLLDMDPALNRRELFASVGAQLQETSYQEHITVREVCQAFSTLYEKPVPWRRVLERFRIADKVGTQVAKLSGGQKQRLTIALALIPGPRVVFLDELTTGLDPRARREMWEDVRRLKDDGVTVIMTTHYMEEAEHLCDRVGIIKAGRLAAMDTVESLLDNSALDHLVSFEVDDDGPPPAEDRDARRTAGLLEELDGVAGVRRAEREGERVRLYCDSQHVLAAVVLFLEKRGVTYRNVRTSSPGLEDVFLYLTGDAYQAEAQGSGTAPTAAPSDNAAEGQGGAS